MAAAPHVELTKALRKLADSKVAPDIARFFHTDPNADSADNKIPGIAIGSVFPVAKQYVHMPLAGIRELLASPFYEVRMAAVSVMDFQARAKNLTAEYHKALFELYLERHDRINNWDLVDRAAPYVVGGYLMDKPRDVLYELA